MRKKKAPSQGGSRPRRGRKGSATAAAAGEQQDDEDDPDPVVVVEHVAQTVVHSEPPKRYEVGRRWRPSPLSLYVEGRRMCVEKKEKGCRDGTLVYGAGNGNLNPAGQSSATNRANRVQMER